MLVSGIAFDKDQARVTLRDVHDRPGSAASIFSPLGKAGIVVDMIIQTASRDGVTDMAFTVSRKDLKRTLDVLQQAEPACSSIEHSSNIAKVSVVGVGMRNHSGAASRAFDALYKAGHQPHHDQHLGSEDFLSGGRGRPRTRGQRSAQGIRSVVRRTPIRFISSLGKGSALPLSCSFRSEAYDEVVMTLHLPIPVITVLLLIGSNIS